MLLEKQTNQPPQKPQQTTKPNPNNETPNEHHLKKIPSWSLSRLPTTHVPLCLAYAPSASQLSHLQDYINVYFGA